MNMRSIFKRNLCSHLELKKKTNLSFSAALCIRLSQ